MFQRSVCHGAGQKLLLWNPVTLTWIQLSQIFALARGQRLSELGSSHTPKGRQCQKDCIFLKTSLASLVYWTVVLWPRGFFKERKRSQDTAGRDLYLGSEWMVLVSSCLGYPVHAVCAEHLTMVVNVCLTCMTSRAWKGLNTEHHIHWR